LEKKEDSGDENEHIVPEITTVPQNLCKAYTVINKASNFFLDCDPIQQRCKIFLGHCTISQPATERF
jgi:hypothetical protein